MSRFSVPPQQIRWVSHVTPTILGVLVYADFELAATGTEGSIAWCLSFLNKGNFELSYTLDQSYTLDPIHACVYLIG